VTDLSKASHSTLCHLDRSEASPRRKNPSAQQTSQSSGAIVSYGFDQKR
jgi:hypothetical protein